MLNSMLQALPTPRGTSPSPRLPLMWPLGKSAHVLSVRFWFKMTLGICQWWAFQALRAAYRTEEEIVIRITQWLRA